MSYAKGKYAFGFCDKTGFRYPLKDLVPEYRNGVKTGFLVGRDVVDPDQPQNFLGRFKIHDPQALRNPRPEQNLDSERAIQTGYNPVGFKEIEGITPPNNLVAVGAVGTVVVNEIDNQVSLTGVAGSAAVGSVTVIDDAATFDSTSITLDSTSQTFDEG